MMSLPSRVVISLTFLSFKARSLEKKTPASQECSSPETLSVAAMRISNEDCSPVTIKG
jgi:hypothetical protein